MTKNSDDGKHAMLFVFTDRLLRSHFLKKKTWKNAIFRIYRPLPYSSRDGENMLSSCPSARQNNPKNPREFCVA